MTRGTPIAEARIISLRDGGYIVFDASFRLDNPAFERQPVFACSDKDALLDYLEKRLAEPQGEEYPE